MALTLEEGLQLGGLLGDTLTGIGDKFGITAKGQAKKRADAVFNKMYGNNSRLAQLASNPDTGQPYAGSGGGGLATLTNPPPLNLTSPANNYPAGTPTDQPASFDAAWDPANQMKTADMSGGAGAKPQFASMQAAPPQQPPLPQVAPQAPQSAPSQAGDPSQLVSDADLISVLRDPDVSDQDRQIALMFYKQRQDAKDPDKALERQLTQAKIASLNAKEAPQDEYVSAGDGRVFNKRTGQFVNNGNSDASAGQFKGNSVEAQGLNFLVESGRLTPEQAAQLAAGKTVTDQSTGQVTFMTPDGIFGLKPGDAAPQPIIPGAPSQPAAPGSAPQAGGRPGAIPLTSGRAKTLTGEQANALTFGSRMQQADSIIAAGGEKDPTQSLGAKTATIGNALLNSLPSGAAVNAVVNNIRDADTRKVMQAKLNFVTAALRKESGAAISQSEFADADRLYFPQPGDDAGVLAQKAQTRALAIQTMQEAAGRPLVGGAAPTGAVRKVIGGKTYEQDPATGKVYEVTP